MLKSFISFQDLILAYRKAKADLYYERDHVGSLNFLSFERQFVPNLKKLHAMLVKSDADWMTDPEIVGTYSYIPKSCDPASGQRYRDSDSLTTVMSDPIDAWRLSKPKSTFDPSFRLIGDHPVAYHIISALWILKVGYLYDEALSSDAYGSRLRRSRDDIVTRLFEPNAYQPLNVTSIGSFKPYSYAFRSWRDGGLKAARDGLAKNKSRVVAVTADLRKFYHSTSPNFLIDRKWLALAGVTLSKSQRLFTEQFLLSMRFWASRTPLHKDNPSCGLSVGLSAARVIANCALVELDEAIASHLKPLYYGRYVDDIFLVMKGRSNIQSAEDAWDLIVNKLGGLITKESFSEGPGFQLHLVSHEDSNLVFSGKKQKVFLLSGPSGRHLLESISHQVARRSSEWRLLPDLPEQSTDLTHDILCGSDDSTEEADNLRKADGISVRRLSFAIRLRNLETIERDLEPDQWATYRKAFFEIAQGQILVLPRYFEYAAYIPRLIGLAVSAGDWTSANRLYSRIKKVFGELKRFSQAKGYKEQRAYCWRHTLQRIIEGVLAALPGMLSLVSNSSKLSSFLKRIDWVSAGLGFSEPLSPKSAVILARELFLADFGRRPFRELFTDPLPWMRNCAVDVITDSHLSEFPESLKISTAMEFLRDAFPLKTLPGLPMAIAFPTRAFHIQEMTLANQELIRDPNKLREVVMALRGVEYNGGVQAATGMKDNVLGQPELIRLSFSRTASAGRTTHMNMGITCLRTKDLSWSAATGRWVDPDWERYFRVNRLVNDALSSRTPVDYLVFPELSLPRRWFARLAFKLLRRRTSLIAGVEYLHHGGTLVSNQVHAALAVDFDGWTGSCIVVQEKERPSHHECEKLALHKKKLMPSSAIPVKYIIKHGNFIFGMLICSELTNIDLRRRYRGRVDALIIPEWNQDTETFSSIIESTAFDVHCYVAQVNNREYGDCRIRGPINEIYWRDLARVKGGIEDYMVIGSLDFEGLRRHQAGLPPINTSGRNIPTFKPLPDGFSLDPIRTSLNP